MSLVNNVKLVTGTAIGAGVGLITGSIAATSVMAFTVTAPVSYPTLGALLDSANNYFNDGDKSMARAAGEGALKGLIHVPLAPVVGPLMAVSEIAVTPVLGGAFGLWVASLTCEGSSIPAKWEGIVKQYTEEAGEPAQSSEMGATQPV